MQINSDVYVDNTYYAEPVITADDNGNAVNLVPIPNFGQEYANVSNLAALDPIVAILGTESNTKYAYYYRLFTFASTEDDIVEYQYKLLYLGKQRCDWPYFEPLNNSFDSFRPYPNEDGTLFGVLQLDSIPAPNDYTLAPRKIVLNDVGNIQIVGDGFYTYDGEKLPATYGVSQISFGLGVAYKSKYRIFDINGYIKETSEQQSQSLLQAFKNGTYIYSARKSDGTYTSSITDLNNYKYIADAPSRNIFSSGTNNADAFKAEYRIINADFSYSTCDDSNIGPYARLIYWNRNLGFMCLANGFELCFGYLSGAKDSRKFTTTAYGYYRAYLDLTETKKVVFTYAGTIPAPYYKFCAETFDLQDYIDNSSMAITEDNLNTDMAPTNFPLVYFDNALKIAIFQGTGVENGTNVSYYIAYWYDFNGIAQHLQGKYSCNRMIYPQIIYKGTSANNEQIILIMLHPNKFLKFSSNNGIEEIDLLTYVPEDPYLWIAKGA